MKGTYHRLKRKVRALTAQKRRLVQELRAAKALCRKQPAEHYAAKEMAVS